MTYASRSGIQKREIQFVVPCFLTQSPGLYFYMVCIENLKVRLAMVQATALVESTFRDSFARACIFLFLFPGRKTDVFHVEIHEISANLCQSCSRHSATVSTSNGNMFFI